MEKTKIRDLHAGWLPESPYALLPVLCKGILDMLGDDKRLQLLDIACGPSGSSTLNVFNYYKKIGVNVEITSIDVNPESCGKFSKLLKDNGYGDNAIRVKQMDAASLSFADETFDLITGVGALSNFDDPERAIKEAKRVLKKDGKLLLADVFLPKTVKELWQQLFPYWVMAVQDPMWIIMI